MAAPVVTRTTSIKYNGFAMGLATNYHIHGGITFEQDYTSMNVTWQIFLQHDTAATFNTQALALEAAMRVVNGTFEVKVNTSSTWVNTTQSGNTGMLAQPSISKSASAADSGNSRLYDCSVTLMLPADETGKDGRLTSNVSISTDGAEVQTLNVSATYTAKGAVGVPRLRSCPAARWSHDVG